MKKFLSILLCVVMMFSLIAPISSFAEEDFLFYTTYSDIQAFEKSADLKWYDSATGISSQTIDKVYLAKNEREGFQIFFYEVGDGRNLKVSVDEFVNSNGEVLPHNLYNEVYLKPTGVTDVHFADALVPYDSDVVETAQGENYMFYVDLKSNKNQTSGDYYSKITLYDGDEVIAEKNFTATVWNFALPESHYGTTFAGLYDSASRYTITGGFLSLNGVRFSNYEVIDEDKEYAEEILEGWDEFLLDHGVSPYEIPRFMIDNDKKQAELALADTRRSAFLVPLLTKNLESNGELHWRTNNKILQYKDIVYENKFLNSKALFYYADEVTWATEEDASGYLAFSDKLSSIWPGYHSVVPLNSKTNYDVKKSILLENSDILCLNQGLLARDPEMVNEFTDNSSWTRTWRYGGDTLFGGTPLYRWQSYNMGLFARIMYWQADALDSEGILNWNYGYVPFNGTSAYNVFEDNSFAKDWLSLGNGDGALVYAGGPLGLDPTVPIASLRLKHVNNGMDDYDYLQLAKEAFGEDSTEYNNAINSVLRHKDKGLEHIFEPWDCAITSGIRQEWIHNDSRPMNNARIALGNLLSNANLEHEYGEWETAVSSDDSHNGLEIRECTNCGAKESRETDAVTCEHPETEVKGAVAATCTKEGFSGNKVCKTCGVTIEKGVTTDKIPHTYTSTVTASTCTTDGYTTYKCFVCGDTYKANEVDATGHTSDGGKVTKAATCSATGAKTYTCTVCKAVIKTETIAKLAHNYTSTVTEPNCTLKGYTTYTCTACGNSYTDSAVSALGHTDENGDEICDRCGTSMHKEEPSKTCSCNCHKSGFMGFIYKLQRLFWKMFKTHKTCDCGAVHY